MPPLTKTTGKKEYVTQIGDTPANILVGGEDAVVGNKFVPNWNMHKWNNESFLNINAGFSIVDTEIETFVDGTVEIEVGPYKHRYYVDVNNDLEYELEVASFAFATSIQFDLLFSEDLEFWYQGELTSEEIARGANRPENVIGSYAVYWKNRHNQYKTGKFCHIYRPKVTDSDGNEVWADLNINFDSQKMEIDIPMAWLLSAVFPIIIDPNIGYDSIGASQWGTDDRRAAIKNNVVAGSSGTCNTVYIYVKDYEGSDWNRDVHGGVYDDDSGINNLLESGTKTASWISPGWNAITLDSTINIVNGNTYYPACAWGTGNGGVAYDTGSSGDSEYGYSATLPGTWSGTNDNWLESIYLEFSSGGNPVSLASSISIQTTINSNSKVNKKLISAIDITSAISGSIKTIKKLFSIIQNSFDLISSVRVSRFLNVEIDIQSNVLGSITKIIQLTGGVNSVSSFDAYISVIRKLEALIGSVSATESLVSIDKKFISTIAANSNASGYLKVIRYLVSSIQCETTVNSILALDRHFDAQIDSQSSLSSVIKVGKKFNASIDTISTVSGAMDMAGAVAIASEIICNSALLSGLNVSRKLESSVDAQSDVNAMLRIIRGLITGIQAESTMMGDLSTEAIVLLAATIDALSSTDSLMKVSKALSTGDINAASNLQAVANILRSISTSISSSSTVIGVLAVTLELITGVSTTITSEDTATTEFSEDTVSTTFSEDLVTTVITE